MTTATPVAPTPARATASPRMTLSRLTVGSLRELDTIGIISALASMYAAVLIMATASLITYRDYLNTIGEGQQGLISGAGTIATCFLMIALFVGGVTIANGVTAVIAGRASQLALLRQLGASTTQLRRSVVVSVAMVAAVGALVGTLVGATALALVRDLMVRRGILMQLDYPFLSATLITGFVAVVATAVVATLSASRTALSASAVHAANVSQRRAPGRAGRLARGIIATVVIGFGALVLVMAVFMGEDPNGVGFVAAFFGSALTVIGLLIGAQLIVPRLVSLVGRLLGSDPASVVARRNAVLDPMRTTRSTMGILLGVTLITTVAAGMDAVATSLRNTGAVNDDSRILVIVTWVMIGLIGISALMSAVGFVSTMSLTVIGRTREIGLLRTLGLTAAQVRTMIVKESVALSGTATVAGMALGIMFGAVGAQSLLGSINTGLVVGLPWGTLALIALGAAVVVILSSVVPSRKAMSVSPVQAMAHS